MYLQRLSLKQFRAFTDVTVDFCVPGSAETEGLRFPNLTVIVGENGAGKSSLLRAACVAMTGEVLPQISTWRPKYNVQAGRGGAYLWERATLDATLDSTDGETATVNTKLHAKGRYGEILKSTCDSPWIREWHDSKIFHEPDPTYFLCGFGSPRRSGPVDQYKIEMSERSDYPAYQRVATLFQPHTARLVPMGTLFSEISDDRAHELSNLLSGLLPSDVRLTRRVEAGELSVQYRGRRLPFAALSDGYRAHIGWISDMLYHAQLAAKSDDALPELSGVILVDEVDLHLHPEWQQTILPRLCRTFPRLQFIVTTHSPTVVGSVESANLRILRQAKNGNTRIRTAEREVWGLSADQVLMSGAFGLRHTRNPEFVGELRDMEDRATQGDAVASLRYQQMLAHGGAAPSSFDEDELPQWIKDVSTKRESPSDRP